MNWELVINAVLAQAAAGTKDIQEVYVKQWAGVLAELIKSSGTTIDDTLVKSVLLPNIDTFVEELKAQLA